MQYRKNIGGLLFAGCLIAFSLLVFVQPKPDDQEPILSTEAVIDLRVENERIPTSLPEGANGYQLLIAARDQHTNFSFSGSDSEYGFFVEEINGTTNDASSNTYWSLYINDELSMVGISEYIPTETDVIDWRYEQVEL